MDLSRAAFTSRREDSQSLRGGVFHCMFSQVRGPKAARMFVPFAGPSVNKVLVLRGGWVGFYMKVAAASTAGKKHCSIPPNYVPDI